jgi:hypothetical protein
MRYFAGLDVSLEETAVCIVDEAGLIVREARVASESWRAMLIARRMMLNKRRDVENGVRALLREAGLKVGTPSQNLPAPRSMRRLAR